MRDRRMGMGCTGCIFLHLSWNIFPRLPLPCDWAGLSGKQLQVRRRKETDCLLCCASCQISPGQEPASYLLLPSEEEEIAPFNSFLNSFAHFSFQIVNFQAYSYS